MFYTKEETGLWVVDIQEKLFPQLDESSMVLPKMCLMLDAARLLSLPIMATMQYPKGLGEIIEPIASRLPQRQPIYSKTAFSGYFDPLIKTAADELSVTNWILIGVEAHICVLQTAKDLLAAGKQVAIPFDAVASKRPIDLEAALYEYQTHKIRISSVETLIYELMRDARSSEFKELLPLIKNDA